MWEMPGILHDAAEMMNAEYETRNEKVWLLVNCPAFINDCFALLRFFERRTLVVGGHAIVFVSPVAEVEQFAAFGAERAKRIVLPLDGFIAGWTLLHKAFSMRRKGAGNGKGKSSV
jgi:hypothetical protein